MWPADPHYTTVFQTHWSGPGMLVAAALEVPHVSVPHRRGHQ